MSEIKDEILNYINQHNNWCWGSDEISIRIGKTDYIALQADAWGENDSSGVSHWWRFDVILSTDYSKYMGTDFSESDFHMEVEYDDSTDSYREYQCPWRSVNEKE